MPTINTAKKPIRRESTAYTLQQEERMIEMYRDGLTLKVIAEEIGKSYDAIDKKIDRLIEDGRLVRRLLPSPFPILGNDDDVLVSEGDALVIPDMEAPFHHSDFLNRVIDLAHKWGVKTLHMAGDLVHYESLSKWGSQWTAADESKAEKLSDFLLSIDDPELRAKGIELMEELAGYSIMPDKSYSAEIEASRKTFAAIQSFDRILCALGNHDDRFIRALDKEVDSKELLHQIGVSKDARWEISKYYYTKLRTSKGEFRITHQRGSGANAAVDLCAQFHTHVLCAHTHRWSMQKDKSGKLWAILMGHAVDERRLSYVMTRDARRDSHALGACIIRDGVPYLLHEDIDWNRMAAGV